MAASCNQCGDCCRVVVINNTKEAINSSTSNDAKWIKEHFTEITLKEAQKVNPNYISNNTSLYFICDAYDDAESRCTAYEDRPKMCSEFPWYEYKHNKENLNIRIFPFCSYREEIDPTYNDCSYKLVNI